MACFPARRWCKVLSVGLGPFVKTLPGSGKVGVAVKILGTKLTRASEAEITTTVPAGATTGTVEVVTPSGTLSSNVPYRVLP